MHLKGPMIFELQFPCREWVQPVSSLRVRAGTEDFNKFSKVFVCSNTHIKDLRRAGLSSAYAGKLLSKYILWLSFAESIKGLITVNSCTHELKWLDSRHLGQTIGPSKRSQEKFGGLFYFWIKGRCRVCAYERTFLSLFQIITQWLFPDFAP